jgi:hypothetical protein
VCVPPLAADHQRLLANLDGDIVSREAGEIGANDELVGAVASRFTRTKTDGLRDTRWAVTKDA